MGSDSFIDRVKNWFSWQWRAFSQRHANADIAHHARAYMSTCDGEVAVARRMEWELAKAVDRHPTRTPWSEKGGTDNG